jgi:ribosome-binding factor A
MKSHKDLQLCRQVLETLTYAVAELDDPLIDELAVASVVPAPSSARVLITLVGNVDADAALARIREHADDLREDVAADVNRKRAPELVFRIGHRDELS